MELWWNRAERLEWELQALRSAGFQFDDPGDLTREGPITVQVHAVVDGADTPLDVTFPELYPYFRFEVVAPTLDLPHHQNPFSKSLCLIGRNTENWELKDSAAAFLCERLPRVVSAGRATDAAEVADVEERQAEPITEFFTYEQNCIVLVDGSWALPPDFRHGDVVIGLEEPQLALRGAVLKVRDAAQREVLELPPDLARNYGRQIIRAPLLRLYSPIVEDGPRRFLAAARARVPDARPAQSFGVPGGKISVTAIILPEEVHWREEGEGWVFVVEAEQVVPTRGKPGGKAKPGVRRLHYFARVGRAGRDDLVERAPELAPLRTRAIAQFGLGCIGAPSALEFARAGLGDLRLLDRDFVDPGTVVRWPHGLRAAGWTKTTVIQQTIEANYPYTKVAAFRHVLGLAEGDSRVVAEMLDGVSLVYDAAAELGISHFLADAARSRGIPYVGVSGTQGAWGGVVVVLRPGDDQPCWFCFRRAQNDGRIPPAPHDPVGSVQPVGCGDPTFTGAGFDLVSLAMLGVRAAVGELAGGAGGYPAGDWDVLVASLRDGDGRVIAPSFQTFQIPRYPDCPACGVAP